MTWAGTLRCTRLYAPRAGHIGDVRLDGRALAICLGRYFVKGEALRIICNGVFDTAMATPEANLRGSYHKCFELKSGPRGGDKHCVVGCGYGWQRCGPFPLTALVSVKLAYEGSGQACHTNLTKSDQRSCRSRHCHTHHRIQLEN